MTFHQHPRHLARDFADDPPARIDGSIPAPRIAPVIDLTPRPRGYRCDGCRGEGSMPTHRHECWRFYLARLWNSAPVTDHLAALAAWESHRRTPHGETRAQRADWVMRDAARTDELAATARALLTEMAQQAGAR